MSGATEYAHAMRSLLAVVVLIAWPSAVLAADATVTPVPVEDYPFFDQVIISKFLTSETTLVVIERMTTTQLSPQQDGPLTAAVLRELEAFDGTLPPELVRDFVSVNQEPARLEARFQFGVRYRLVSGHGLGEPEVSLAYPASTGRAVPAQGAPVVERLAFSRVGRTLRNDQAVLYVEQNRPDGDGAGLLVWFRRKGRDWLLVDTDVLWTIGEDGEPEDVPLAP